MFLGFPFLNSRLRFGMLVFLAISRCLKAGNKIRNIGNSRELYENRRILGVSE